MAGAAVNKELNELFTSLMRTQRLHVGPFLLFLRVYSGLLYSCSLLLPDSFPLLRVWAFTPAPWCYSLPLLLLLGFTPLFLLRAPTLCSLLFFPTPHFYSAFAPASISFLAAIVPSLLNSPSPFVLHSLLPFSLSLYTLALFTLCWRLGIYFGAWGQTGGPLSLRCVVHRDLVWKPTN